MNLRKLYAAAAVLTLAIAIMMPTEWYATIPRFADVDNLPFSGVNLLRLVFLFEAVLLAAVAILDARFIAHPEVSRNFFPTRREVTFDIDARSAMLLLIATTLLATWLRVHRLNLDLWLDEISPLLDYSHLSAVQVIGSYLRSNNHLLNTLLEKAVIATLGESEWSVRLPATVFGILGVPALYWFARFGLSRVASLIAALLLACSYHHIFFSQNARGYSGYILFAIVSTGMLLRALRDDGLWQWTLYVISAVLGMISLILTAFVMTGHVLLAAVLIWRARRAGHAIEPMARRLIAVVLVAGLLAFQIYAAALPEAYVTLTTQYAEPATGFSVFSMDLVNEIIRGVTVGFGSPAIALVFLLAGALG
ncbi:MAG: glycosyltransferase family 39 protein, partial [Gemmatimonadaceae bacterium]